MLDVKTLLTKLMGVTTNALVTESKQLIDNWTINANSYNNTTVSVAKTGYQPIAVVGFRLANASSGGTRNTYCSQHTIYISGNNVTFTIRNNDTGNAAKIMVYADILYRPV